MCLVGSGRNPGMTRPRALEIRRMDRPMDMSQDKKKFVDQKRESQKFPRPPRWLSGRVSRERRCLVLEVHLDMRCYELQVIHSALPHGWKHGPAAPEGGGGWGCGCEAHEDSEDLNETFLGRAGQ